MCLAFCSEATGERIVSWFVCSNVVSRMKMITFLWIAWSRWSQQLLHFPCWCFSFDLKLTTQGILLTWARNDDGFYVCRYCLFLTRMSSSAIFSAYPQRISAVTSIWASPMMISGCWFYFFQTDFSSIPSVFSSFYAGWWFCRFSRSLRPDAGKRIIWVMGFGKAAWLGWVRGNPAC